MVPKVTLHFLSIDLGQNIAPRTNHKKRNNEKCNIVYFKMIGIQKKNKSSIAKKFGKIAIDLEYPRNNWSKRSVFHLLE